MYLSYFPILVVFPLHFEKDAGKKAALKEKMKTETFPKFLTQVGKVHQFE